MPAVIILLDADEYPRAVDSREVIYKILKVSGISALWIWEAFIFIICEIRKA